MSARRVVAIVPVRGGSVGIPRKNARLLAGKPLLAYVVEAALATPSLDQVYVSTEDEELAELARRFGAQVLPRSPELADGKTTLDDVVVDACRSLAVEGTLPDYVVTLQATCPLLKAHTIEQAVTRCINEQLDTVLTVVDDRHLTWGQDAAGRVVPEYEARVNRQLLPPRFRETGGVVVCSSPVLATGTRFGRKVGTVVVDKAQALDIDDAFDWWLAERFLGRKKIVFRVVGDRETGLGHVFRALTLADRLIHHDVSFVVEPGHALAKEVIERRFYPVRELDRGHELAQIIASAPDLVIHDVLDTAAEPIVELAEHGIATLNFEDLGPGSFHADYVINAMYDAHPRRDGRVMSGARYCVLRDEFYSATPHRAQSAPSHQTQVLLLFGGTDPNDLTRRCLTWLDELEAEFAVTVVVGLGYPFAEAVKALAESCRHAVEVIVHSPVLSKHMARADIAVTSAGRTVFELASLHVPMLVIPQNDRECHHEFAMGAAGVITLPRASQISKESFQGAASQLLSSDLLRESLGRALAGADIRGGVESVLGIITRALDERERN